MVAKSDVQLKIESYSVCEELWIHTLFAKLLHFAKWVYHTKKIKEKFGLKS